MERTLGTALLRDGASLSMSVLETPAPEYERELATFYAHKGERWQYHIEAALRGPLDDLQTRFYLGRCGEELVVAVTTITHRGIGYVGHVYTEVAHRGRGACSALFPAVMADVAAQGGRAIYLTTGYASRAYRIYERAGFQSRYPHSGEMEWFPAGARAFEAAHFRAGACHVEPIRWEHWAGLNPLTARKGETVVSYGLHEGLYSATHFEYDFLLLKWGLESFPGWDGRVLVSEHGAVVGLATLIPRWGGDGLRVLDVLVHPAFAGETPAFLAEMPLGDGPLLAYAAAGDGARVAALEGVGFRVDAVAPARCSWAGEQPADRLLLRRP